ncbi:hypothetical protein QN096_06830 [Metapseudomonas otitidis]|uniref:hypothetical protein n=1 Tax=Metapseudomonas otitidis TaxID=319939 RepID=UPI00253F847F|nr:hypothetical protein [Pseudomonas otitidis]WIF68846.1 hypothetical protein QN096_06830 [Pseudomonas otitidis]
MTSIKLLSGRSWNPGVDPYSYQRAVENNRELIERSDKCGCIGCGEIFAPSKIVKWWDGGQTACCPYCCMTSVVVGSASGLPIDKQLLSIPSEHLAY